MAHGVYRHIGHPNGPRTMIDEGVCCCFMSQFPDEVVAEERRLREQAGLSNSAADGNRHQHKQQYPSCQKQT